jgi:hypothetical protein
MKPAKTSGAAGVAPRIIGAPLPKVSAVEKAGGVDLGAKNYTVSSNRSGPVNRRTHSAQGTSQADVGAGAGVGLAKVVVTPRRNKAALARERKPIRTAEIGSDEEGGSPALPAAGHARRLAKKGTTKAQAPTVATAGLGAKQPFSPAIILPESQPPSEGFAPTEEIDSDDPNDGGAQARTDRADEESAEGDGPPLPLSLRWGMEELQQRVYQERMAASVLAVAVSNAHLWGKEGIDEAEAAIDNILTPQKGGPTALESALDSDASKT